MNRNYGSEIDGLYDQSFSEGNLSRLLVKSDFRGVAKADVERFRRELLTKSVVLADDLFLRKNPLQKFHLKQKDAYRADSLAEDIVIRQITKNLRALMPQRPSGRDFIVKNLSSLLREGVPYRIYRLDIQKFYPSISQDIVMKEIRGASRLSPQTKTLVENLLAHFFSLGGNGVPLGLQISAPLTDLVMRGVDVEASRYPGTYFYSRYVDDIIAITNHEADEDNYIKYIEGSLPKGLLLHSGKKCFVGDLRNKMTPQEADRKRLEIFSYLGYEFSIFDPTKKAASVSKYREIDINISRDKINKLKMKIARAAIEFAKTGDFAIFLDRVRFLTNNFSITDKRTGRKRMAGVFYSYPLLSKGATSLVELDEFLRLIVLKGRHLGYRGPRLTLSNSQKRLLLANSFFRGHQEKPLINFSSAKIAEIQRCWANE